MWTDGRWIAVALLSGACGKVTPVGVSAVKACTDLGQAVCMKRDFCTNGAGIIRANGDMGTCVTREELTCMIALAAPDTGNTPDAVESCVAAYSSYMCADFLNGNLPAACTPAGSRATNQPCTFNGQCATAFCGRAKNTTCGVCAPQPAPGDSCASSGCGRNQTCDDTSMTCVAFGEEGAACGASAPCGAYLNCFGANATTGNIGTCEIAADAAGLPCGAGTAGCDQIVGVSCGGAAGARTCMPIIFAGNGATCGVVGDAPRVGCKGGGCYGTARLIREGEVGTCKADAPDGSACDAMLGPACMPPARCLSSGNGTAGVCTVPDAVTCT